MENMAIVGLQEASSVSGILPLIPEALGHWPINNSNILLCVATLRQQRKRAKHVTK